jgi:RNA recognition motif-containing protein
LVCRFRCRTAATASNPKEKTQSMAAAGEPFTAYIGNLPTDTTAAQVNAVFGGAKDVRVINKGLNTFAYAEFATKDQLSAALQLSGTAIGGREVKVDVATPQQQRGGGGGRGRGGVAAAAPVYNADDLVAPFTAYLGNLPTSMTAAEISAAFRGTKDVRVINKGLNTFAYAEFETKAQLLAALKLSGSNVGGREVKVDVATPQQQSRGTRA